MRCCLLLFVFFVCLFFQAEDGIRDLVRSRGLGDVYKRQDEYRSGLPGPEDILLIIEVADSSVEYDQGGKSLLYARAGIQEYWIVNLPAQIVEVHRQPRDGSYRSLLRLTVGDTADLLAFPDVTLSVAAILGAEPWACLLYTSDAADERSSVDLGGRRIIKKKNKQNTTHDQYDE